MGYPGKFRLKLFIAGLVWAALALLSGCAVTQNAGQRMANLALRTQGEYYLSQGKYQEGIVAFTPEADRQSANADLHYYLGRCHLALEQIEAGRNHLTQAFELDPANADFCFWLGMARGAAGHPRRERQTYTRCLELDPQHPLTLIYLGHNLLNARRYEAALSLYQRGLAQLPTHPQALYNRAFALDRLGRTPEALTAGKIYLAYYPDGPFARRAVAHLNRHGDFEYRLYRIGKRRLAMPRLGFLPLSDQIDSVSGQTLDRLGRILSQGPELNLQIICYQKNNPALAKARALQLKATLLKQHPSLGPARIQTSWFQVPQELTLGGRTHHLDSSVQLFSTP
ncbi:MAG: tetratricopeptide repeat protein [Desulfobacterales bacterium]